MSISKTKRFLVFVLAMAMTVTMCPVNMAFAASDDADNGRQVIELDNKAANEEADFTANSSDISKENLAFEVSYIAEHYNEAYIDGVVEDAQFAPVSLARGVATYTRKTYGENFENGDIPSNIISSQEYTIPIYDVDPDSDYYVMIANVNLADQDAKPYDMAVIWNNNLGNNLEDVFYDESTSILYVNKYYIDNPDMSQVDTEGEPIAVQTLYQWDENYYADGTADYGKDLPVIVSNASGSEVEERTVAVNNMFDLTTIIPSVVENPSRYTIDDFDICMNGSFAPLDDSAYHYDNETGEITLDASASTISSLMIYVNDGSILNSLTSAFSVKAGVPSNMAYLKYKNETVKFSSEMREKWFLGWRGHYGPNQTKNKWTVAHGTGHTKLKGETESLKYLYRPNTKSAYWAISSYTRGKNFSVSNDTGVTATKKYRRYNKKKGTKKTLYDWMRSYLDNIDKFNGKYWSAHPSFKQTKYNGAFQGCNCFTFRMPNHFVGAEDSGTDPGNLVSEGPNKGVDCKSLDVKMADGQKFKPVSNGFYGCCRHLKLKYDSNDTMGGGNKKARIDVAVLALTDDYVVLSFCNNKTVGRPGDTQEGMAIYKFAFDDTVDPQFSTTLKDYGVSDPGVKWDDREPGNVKIQDEILYKDLDTDNYKVNAVMKISDSVNLDPNAEEEDEGENGGEDETEEEAINVTGEDPDVDDGNDGGVSSVDGVVTIDGNNVYINTDQDAYSSYTGGVFFVVVTDSTGAQVAVEDFTNNEATIPGLTADHTITVYYGTSSTDMSRPVVSTPYVESAGIDDGPGAPADDEDTEELAKGTVIAKTDGKVSPNAAFKVNNTGKSQKDWQRGSFVTLGMNSAGTKYVDVYKSGLYNGVGLFNTEYKAGVQARIYLGDKSKSTLNANLKKAAEATKITCPFGTLTFDKEALYNYPEGTTKSVVETGAKFNVYNSKYKSYEEAVAANKDYEHYEYDQIVIADHLINRTTPDGKVVLSDYLDWQHHNGMLVPGTYVVEEVTAGNFAKSHQLIDSFTVKVEKRKITDAGEKDNTPYEYELTVEKRSTNPWREGWEPYTEDPLYSELTQFRIESIDDPTNAFVADGQPPAASNAQHAYLSQPGFTVDKNTTPWTIKINNLKAGHYRITEDAPLGYWMPKDKAAIEFEVYRDMDKNLKVDVDSIVEHEGKWTEIDTRTKETKDRQETKVTFTRSNVPQGTEALKILKTRDGENALGNAKQRPFPYVEFNLYADPDNPQTEAKDDGGDIVAYDGHADHIYYKAGDLIRGIIIDEETGERHYYNDGKEVSEETYRIMTDLEGKWDSSKIWDANTESLVAGGDKAFEHYPLNNNNLIDTYDKDGKKTGNKDGVSYYKFQEAYVWMYGDHVSFTDAEKARLNTIWTTEYQKEGTGYGSMEDKIGDIGLSMNQILNHGIDVTENDNMDSSATGDKTFVYSSFGKRIDSDPIVMSFLQEEVLQFADFANGVDDTKETIYLNKQLQGTPVGEVEYNLLVLWPDQLTQFPKIPETFSEFQVLPDNVDETHWIPTVLQEFPNPEPPMLKTVATVNGTDSHRYDPAAEKVTIHDTISYYNLKKGSKYVFTGTLYNIDKAVDESGAPILDENGNQPWVLGEPIRDENGNVYEVKQDEVPSNVKGKVDMMFDVIPKQLNYSDVVVVEKCELEGDLIAQEMDPNVESQQVHTDNVVVIETVATYNGKHIMPNDTDVTFTDTVEYWGAMPGTEYVLKGQLMDKETGDPVKDADGKDIVSESKPFTPTSKHGFETVEFSLNTSDLDGKSVVVFEELCEGGSVIAEHKEITDENQTIIIPSVETTATDTETKAHVGEVNTTEKIVDVVKYTNLIPGEKYRVDGKLMRKEKASAEPVAEAETTPADQTPAENTEVTQDATQEATPATPSENGEAPQDATQEAVPADAATDEAPVVLAEASEEFTAEKADGEVKLTFTVDSTQLKGYSSVAFEELVDLETGVVIGMHKDIEDEDQTIHYPEVTTDAVDGKTGLHTGELGSEVTIVDTVTYKNLVPGLEYTLTGTLMDKSTGDPLKVNGKVVKATDKFTPETADGTYDLEFKLDSTALAGTSAVVFEELEYNNVLVAEHKDIEDEDQTVDYPEIGTVAVDGQTQAHEGLADGDVTIVDTVNYKNLTPGVTYIVRGTLMDKETGEPFTGVVATSDTDKASNIAETVANAASDAANSTQDKADATKPATETPAAETPAADTPAADGQTDGQATEPKADGQTDAQVTEPKADETQTPAADAQADTNKQDEAAKTDDTKTDENANKPAEEAAKDTGATAPVEVQFVAPAKDGSVQVTFVVKNADLAGKKLVAFESMYVVGKDGKEVEVARHEDLNDADQTVSYPEIKTNAVDAESEEHVGLVRDKITIKDKVTYKNLTPGQTYTVVGTLMDKETGKAIVAGSDATKSTKKTTTTGSDGTTTAISGQTGLSPVGTATDFRGTVNVYNWGPLDSALKGADYSSYDLFMVDAAKALDEAVGKTYMGVLSGKFSGADDSLTIQMASGEQLPQFIDYIEPGQTGSFYALEYVPLCLDGGKTSAFGLVTINVKNEGTEKAQLGDCTITSIDRHLEDATKTVEGDKKSETQETTPAEKAAEGAQASGAVTAQKTFTAENSEGSVELEFTFTGVDMSNKAAVAFEKLYVGKEIETNKTVATHEDINDADQTVFYPTISTKASYKDGVITDTVTYKNLIPGLEYEVSGTLMDKKSGNSLEISAMSKFTPKEANGSIDMKFEVDKKALAGKTVVVFETLKLNGKVVAEHKDINDKDQTVTIGKETTPSKDKSKDKSKSEGSDRSSYKTGDFLPYILIAILLMILASIAVVERRRRRE